MPDPNRPHNDPVMHPDAEQPRDKARDADHAGGGLSALAGLGCLGFAILPWMIGAGVVLFLFLLGVVFQSCAPTPS